MDWKVFSVQWKVNSSYWKVFIGFWKVYWPKQKTFPNFFQMSRNSIAAAMNLRYIGSRFIKRRGSIDFKKPQQAIRNLPT
ncbi:hypothetical protein [Planococcus sp. ISL-110]|uniref:hypothetical protein n=1 Tax=Planococcus sp. ISL-110 TaxID=2819167 RepID=UPI001BE502CA|nr:hypothetical protein [Planococcus sp. ISL-110]MBT2569277.1 hypothetical protein [Planococcus sp. ISL-110]